MEITLADPECFPDSSQFLGIVSVPPWYSCSACHPTGCGPVIGEEEEGGDVFVLPFYALLLYDWLECAYEPFSPPWADADVATSAMIVAEVHKLTVSVN